MSVSETTKNLLKNFTDNQWNGFIIVLTEYKIVKQHTILMLREVLMNLDEYSIPHFFLYSLSKSKSKIVLLQLELFDKLNYYYLSKNSSDYAVEILLKNLDKIDENTITINKHPKIKEYLTRRNLNNC
jgi:hypothetical protein